jgi:hypothetical protein
MNIVWIILKVAASVFVLKVVCAQSQNFVFMYFKKPFYWIALMFCIGFVYVLSIHRVRDAPTVIFWSAALTYVSLIPPRLKNKEDRKLAKEMADEMYDEMNIKRGRLKYRIGTSAFVVGIIIAYVFFMGPRTLFRLSTERWGPSDMIACE